MSTIFISRIHYPVTTLGPGRRIGIWVQGCSIRCEGCISADTWEHGVGQTSTAKVMEQIRTWAGDADGVTITGGEPFDQPEALIELVKSIKRESIGNLFVYSGYRKGEIQETLDRIGGEIDALMTEPFEYETADTLPLRGSDNQKLHLLTPIGHRHFSSYDSPTKETALDAMFDEDGTVWFCGIPMRNDLERLSALLESRGHKIAFTAQKVSGKSKRC